MDAPFAEAMQAVGIVACAPVINLSPMFPYKPIDSLCQGRRGWNPFLGLLLVLFEVNSSSPPQYLPRKSQKTPLSCS